MLQAGRQHFIDQQMRSHLLQFVREEYSVADIDMEALKQDIVQDLKLSPPVTKPKV